MRAAPIRFHATKTEICSQDGPRLAGRTPCFRPRLGSLSSLVPAKILGTSFIGFDDVTFCPSLQTGGQGQVGVSTKDRFRIDFTSPDHLPDRFHLAELLQKEEPAGPYPWPNLLVLAMEAHGTGFYQGGHLCHQVFLVSMLDHGLQVLPLRQRHGVYSLKTSSTYAYFFMGLTF